MEATLFYIGFALLVALIIHALVYAPIIRQAKELGVENTFTDNPFTTDLVVVLTLALMAPFALLLVVPKFRLAATEGVTPVLLAHGYEDF